MNPETVSVRRPLTTAELAARQPRHHPTSVSQVVQFPMDAPKPTGSVGYLRTPISFDATDRELFFHCEPHELELLGLPIAGLESWEISGLHVDNSSVGEWHRLGQQVVQVTNGALLWICEDLHGKKAEFKLTPNVGIQLPTFVLSRFRALEPSSFRVLSSVCRVLEGAVVDTYDEASFRVLQSAYCSPPS